MKPSVTRTKGQVYSVGNYLMTGKVLGKGHFARVEEATHRVIGKKVAIKIIDLTCIKEEYARRNLHREPKVMARLRHPCIAALYETMMHGPRLYVVMEAAGGGDLCAHVLSARGVAGARGLPESRARHLSVQLVSAVKHMHARGVVHRDLKMENIMLDSTKQFIKIVDFGLSNVWSSSGGLRTPCGSLEYAAPELFLDGRRYGPEVDLWSVGVIVYGMVTGSLPFGGAAGNCAGGEGSGRSRPQLRAAIARGFSRKHKAALAQLSPECKIFVQQLLEPVVENRMKIEEAARHRWLRKPGLRLQAHPLPELELKNSRLIARQISELSGQTLTDVIAEIKADPYGSVGGMYNIKQHLAQLADCGNDPLWGPPDPAARPSSPPVYHPHASTLFKHSVHTSTSPTLRHSPPLISLPNQTPLKQVLQPAAYKQTPTPPCKLGLISSTIPKTVQPAQINPYKVLQPTQSNFSIYKGLQPPPTVCKQSSSQINSAVYKPNPMPIAISGIGNKQTPVFKSQPSTPQALYKACGPKVYTAPMVTTSLYKKNPTCSPEYNPTSCYKSLPASPSYNPHSPSFNPQSPSTFRAVTAKFRVPTLGVRKPIFKVQDNGDGAEPRLPSINENGKLDVQDKFPRTKGRVEDDRLRLHSCPDRAERRTEFYRRAGDGLPSWRATGVTNTSTRILLQTNATTIKRASLGSIVSPHSSSNSHCKSERAVPVGWYSRTGKDTTTPVRLRRTAPIK